MKNLKIKNLNKKDIQNLKEIKIIELEEIKYYKCLKNKRFEFGLNFKKLRKNSSENS